VLFNIFEEIMFIGSRAPWGSVSLALPWSL